MRRISMALLILACAAAGLTSGAAQQASPNNPPANPLAQSRVFAYDDMPAKTAPT